MQFTSLAYLGFFAAVFAVHWAVPQKARWAVCLAASAGFYALLGAPMLAVLALCIAISYLGGLWLQRRRGRRPALALALAAAAALAPLLFFKSFNTLLGAYVPESVRAFSLLTPVGISFFTFKAVAYLAEVYKGALPPCRHFGRYALYVSFFPEVSMGPIQRPGDLMAQIGTPRAFDAGRAVRGAQLMLWGYFEKLVVADNLAPYVSAGRGAGLYADGSYTYGTAVLHPEKSVDAEFKDTFQRIAKNTNRFEYGETPDAESLAQTEALLAFCARTGIEVTAFLPPYAPSVWQRMQETGQYGYIPATFASLETMFARYGFEVFDYSYLPETNDSQYVDGFHGSDRVYAALCARLAEDSLLLGAQFDSAALTALFTAQGNPLTVSLP